MRAKDFNEIGCDWQAQLVLESFGILNLAALSVVHYRIEFETLAAYRQDIHLPNDTHPLPEGAWHLAPQWHLCYNCLSKTDPSESDAIHAKQEIERCFSTAFDRHGLSPWIGPEVSEEPADPFADFPDPLQDPGDRRPR